MERGLRNVAEELKTLCSALGNFLSLPGSIVLERMFAQQQRVSTLKIKQDKSNYDLSDENGDLEELSVVGSGT